MARKNSLNNTINNLRARFACWGGTSSSTSAVRSSGEHRDFLYPLAIDVLMNLQQDHWPTRFVLSLLSLLCRGRFSFFFLVGRHFVIHSSSMIKIWLISCISKWRINLIPVLIRQVMVIVCINGSCRFCRHNVKVKLVNHIVSVRKKYYLAKVIWK